MDELQKPEHKPRGRPKVDEPKAASITAWVPASEYDRLCKLAQHEEKTLSALVRQLLAKKR